MLFGHDGKSVVKGFKEEDAFPILVCSRMLWLTALSHKTTIMYINFDLGV